MSEEIHERAQREADERAEMPPIEEPKSTGTVSMADVERMIKQALDRQSAEHQAQMDALRGELATVRATLPATLVPEHSGGVGVDAMAESWSQYDQELARRGEHPHQEGNSADWLAHPDDIDERRTGPGQVVRYRKSARRNDEAA